MSSVEQRLQQLERQTQDMSRRLAELGAKSEISDLMGRYAVYFSADLGEQLMDELWCADDGISLEYGASGVFETRWKVKTFYCNEAIPGRMNTVAFSSPAITVAADEVHARGVWTALGTQTDAGDLGDFPVTEESGRRALFTSQTEDGRGYRAEVLAQRYEVGFTKEPSGWKIRTLRVGEYFRCPYDRDWVRFAKERFATDGAWLESLFETPLPFPEDAHGENLPSRCTEQHWQYTTDGVSAQQSNPFSESKERVL